MRVSVISAIFAGVSILMSSGAEAQGIGSDFSGKWTGYYAGVQADLLATKSLEEAEPALTAPTLLGDMGGGGGVFAGYDYQLGNIFVAGVLGEFNLDSTGLEVTGNGAGSSRWDAGFAGRIGMRIAPNVLAYARAGYEWGHFDYSNRFAAPTYGNAEFTTSGLEFGVGVDAMLTSNIMGRLEATYTKYDPAVITQGGVPVWQSTPSMIAIKGGVGWRFD
jgi:opacity protein-like surface antigen